MPNSFLEEVMNIIRNRMPLQPQNLCNLRGKSVIKETRTRDGIKKRICIMPRTRGCDWVRTGGGCTMCGFIRTSAYSHPHVPDDFIVEQFIREYKRYSTLRDNFALEIYTSGSFFDNREIGNKARLEILRMVESDPRVDSVLVETRPEFVKAAKIRDMCHILSSKKVQVAVGLETSNDFVRNYCINKGFTYKEFQKAANTIKELCSLVVYLLLKPPFLTEREAAEDTIMSIDRLVSEGPDQIIILPCAVQAYTLTHFLWQNGLYRPPWLWTLVDILKETYGKGAIRAGGFRLSPQAKAESSNCGGCDAEVREAILRFPAFGLSSFQNLRCECLSEWKRELQFDNSETNRPLKQRIAIQYRFIANELGLPDRLVQKTLAQIPPR